MIENLYNIIGKNRIEAEIKIIAKINEIINVVNDILQQKEMEEDIQRNRREYGDG